MIRGSHSIKLSTKFMRAPIMALCMAGVSPSHSAGLQSELEHTFNGMANVTNPGVFQAQRRGVVAGGRLTAKARIFDESLIAITPPGAKGGCGGIDMYGGSFSFVNSDQIVQLLRSVAANAKGYFFQLALSTVSEHIGINMENFQKKVQSLNEHLGNSCQLAQGIVNDSISAMTGKKNTDISLMGSLNGLTDDFFGASNEPDGQSTMAKVRTNARAEYEQRIIGNILWQTMKKHGAASWFRYGDRQLLEVIMSITGSTIVGDMIQDSSGENTNQVKHLPGGKVSLRELVDGGALSLYRCDEPDLCLAPQSVNNVTIKGIAEMITDTLTGTGTNPGGVVAKFARNTGGLQASEQALMASLPGSAGALIRNLAAVSPNAAVQFVDDSAAAIAGAMSYEMMRDLMRAASAAAAQSESPHAKSVQDQIQQSMNRLRDEYQVLVSMNGDVADIIRSYNELLAVTQKAKYMARQIDTASTRGR